MYVSPITAIYVHVSFLHFVKLRKLLQIRKAIQGQ